MIEKIARYWKGLAGGVVGGLTALATALDDGGVTAQEWVWVALGLFAGLGVVYAAPRNRTEDQGRL